MASPLDNILSYFQKRNDPSVLGIDMGSSAIKIVQLKKKRGKAILEYYGELALGAYGNVDLGRSVGLTPERLAQALTDLLKESKFSTKSAGVAIPVRSSLVSVIEMPPVSEKQMNEMVPLEARKYIPVPVSEVTLNWTIVPTEDDLISEHENKLPSKTVSKPVNAPPTKTEVMIVAVHNDVLQNISLVANAAELDVSFYEIEMFSTIRSVIDQEASPVMFFDMGASATKVYIAERGIVHASHIVSRGSQEITQSISTSLGISFDRAEKLKRNYGQNLPEDDKKINEIVDVICGSIFSESNSILMSYQRRYGKNVSKVILVGGGSALKGFKDKAKNYFGIETIIGEPFSKVEAPAFMQNILKTTGMEFAVATGLALRKLQEIE